MPLVFDREQLPKNWPTHHGPPGFWEELGRAVATFSNLEDILARAYFGLTANREIDDPDNFEIELAQWKQHLEKSLTGSLRSLTSKLERTFRDNDCIATDTANNLIARLNELRIWRNALCHGAWQENFDADGSTGLRYFSKDEDGNPMSFENRLTRETIYAIRTETANLTVDIMNSLCTAGIRFPGTGSIESKRLCTHPRSDQQSGSKLHQSWESN